MQIILMGIIFGIVNFSSMQGMTTDEANTFMQGYIYTLTGIAAIFTLTLLIAPFLCFIE